VIPYGRQTVTEEDIAAVCKALRSDFLTVGPLVREFESKFAERVGAKFAVAVCNATAALHLAMLAAKIGPGDRVVTSPNTFLASANCAAFVGATPDFVDIDPVSYCLSPQQLDEKWQPDTKAVVAVHFGGQTAEMPAIAKVAKERGAILIEDACHATGGQFEHHGSAWSIGGHPWADMTTFSFHPVKTLTTGEGGMLVTNNEDYAQAARTLRTHGMVREAGSFEGLGSPALDEQGPWYYEMQQLGYNFRITDFQCALGLSQLSRLSESIARRLAIVARYNQAFSDCPFLTIPKLRNPKDERITSWHLYTVQIDFHHLGISRSELMRRLSQKEVGSQVLYIPVYLQPWYRQHFGYQPGKCPNAEAYYQRALSLPLYPGMTDEDIETVIHSLKSILRHDGS